MVAKEQAVTREVDFPKDLPAMLIRGEVTLGDVFGLDQDTLYEIAQLGYGLLNSGNLREAKEIYLGLVAAAPYDSVFHCHLAAVHHQLGELDEALRQYNEALNFNCANVDALVGLADIQLSRGELTEGVSALKRAVEIDPEGTRESTLRARALLLALMRSVEERH